jgi:hypothetical protein
MLEFAALVWNVDVLARELRAPTGVQRIRMRRTRSSVGLGIALAVIGCTVAVEPLELEYPEDGTDIEHDHTLPETAEPAIAADEGDDRWVDCEPLLGDAEGQVRRELEALCAAKSHDGDCVGLACTRTAPREAFECLLEAGHAERVITLERADVPAARAFAREAMTRVDGWTEARIRDALYDQGDVPECMGCICGDAELSGAGLGQLLTHEDRAAVQPVLAEWAMVEPPPLGLATALRERPTEGWISTARLRRLVERSVADAELRASAAHALALRGDDAGRDALEAAASHSWWVIRNIAVIGLDALDDSDAWDRLAPLLDDETGHVRISLLRLGARLRPDDAVATLDAADPLFAALALPALPTRLFAPRAAWAVCGHRYVDEAEQERLVAALSRMSAKARCRALVEADRRCPPMSALDAPAHAIVPTLADACGLELPAAEAAGGEPALSRCHRTRRKQEAAREQQEQLRLLELERRATSGG